MKETPSDKKLDEFLQPSKFSAQGFLGTDQRPLDEIINADRKALQVLGIDKEYLVTQLKTIYTKIKDALGVEIELKKGIAGRFDESMGRIPSPFREDGTFEKGQAEICFQATGRRIYLTALSINLIERHDFFQGVGSAFRIAPEDVKDLIK